MWESLCRFQASLSAVGDREVSSPAWLSEVLKDLFTSDIAKSSSVITLSGMQQKDTFLSDYFWEYLMMSVAALHSLLRKDAARSTLFPG